MQLQRPLVPPVHLLYHHHIQQQSYVAAVTDGDPPQRVVKVAAGSFHTVALTADGLVFAWGDNRMNQLGVL